MQRLIHLTLFGLAAFIVAAVVAAPPARATKEFAKKENKDCGHCHVSDKGAGARNAIGKEYEANGYRFGVKSWSSDANRDQFLRANSARLATWYAECERILTELEQAETLPGGLARIEGTRDRINLFPRTWLRSAKKLLSRGDRGRPNALKFLTKLETQFPTRKEGKEAKTLLDELAKEHAADVKAARAREAARVTYLKGVTELGLGNWDAGRKLLDTARADPAAKDLIDDIDQHLSEIPD